MSSQIVGTGWRFPILPDAAGGLGYVDGDENVEQSLKILLLTALRQRVMRSDFGCKAPRLVFAPGSVQHLGLLENTVREAVRTALLGVLRRHLFADSAGTADQDFSIGQRHLGQAVQDLLMLMAASNQPHLAHSYFLTIQKRTGRMVVAEVYQPSRVTH